MIIGIVVSILLIGTFCCYQNKWLFFKQRNKTVEPKIENFQKTAVNYNSKVEESVKKEVINLCSNFPIYKNLR